MEKVNRSSVTKIALLVSICMLAMWMLFGTGSTIAWFTDTPDPTVNSFVFGDVSIELKHRVEKGNGNFVFEKVDETTKIFDDEALYEPGYTQTVYLSVENTGDTAVDFRMSAVVDSVKLGYTQEGKAIYLPDYLKYGVEFSSTQKLFETRDSAREIAVNELNDFAQQQYDLKPGEIRYAAIVIYMPESVNNAANYRGDGRPEIGLGISVLASQQGTIDKIS